MVEFKLDSVSFKNKEGNSIVIFVNENNECKIEFTEYIQLDLNEINYIIEQTKKFIQYNKLNRFLNILKKYNL